MCIPLRCDNCTELHHVLHWPENYGNVYEVYWPKYKWWLIASEAWIKRGLHAPRTRLRGRQHKVTNWPIFSQLWKSFWAKNKFIFYAFLSIVCTWDAAAATAYAATVRKQLMKGWRAKLKLEEEKKRKANLTQRVFIEQEIPVTPGDTYTKCK